MATESELLIRLDATTAQLRRELNKGGRKIDQFTKTANKDIKRFEKNTTNSFNNASARGRDRPVRPRTRCLRSHRPPGRVPNKRAGPHWTKGELLPHSKLSVSYTSLTPGSQAYLIDYR